MDPLGVRGDPHPYAYAFSNPVRFDDPLGQDTAGCDVVGSFGFLGWKPLQSPCALECCAKHDACYDRFNCSSSSWYNPTDGCNAGGCSACNAGAEVCLAKCALLALFGAGGDSPNRPNYYCARRGKFIEIPGPEFATLEDAEENCEKDYDQDPCCTTEPTTFFDRARTLLGSL